VHDSRLAEVRDGLSSDEYHLPSQEAAAVANEVCPSRIASPRRACSPDQIDEEVAHRTHWDPDCWGMRSEVPYHDLVVDAASGRTETSMAGHVQDRCSGLETAANAGLAEAQMPFPVEILRKNDHYPVAGTGCSSSQQELHRVSMCVLIGSVETTYDSARRESIPRVLHRLGKAVVGTRTVAQMPLA
jgi:hypothetical protein